MSASLLGSYPTYGQAKTAALELVALTGLSAGIEGPDTRPHGRDVPKRMQTWTVRFLPRPENRYGHELRIEAVEPV